MPVRMPYPYFELRFDGKGKAKDARQLTKLLEGVAREQTTDLFVISHGWNNDPSEAHAFYSELFTNVKAQEARVNVGRRKLAVAGIIWPSKKFDVAEDSPNAASLGNGRRRLAQQVDTLKALITSGGAAAGSARALVRAKALIPKLETSAQARREFCALVVAQLPASVGDEDEWHIPHTVALDLIADDQFLKQLGAPPRKVAGSGTGGATAMRRRTTATSDTFQGAAGIGDFFKGITRGAMNLLNYVTYYQMKARAGTVGGSGVNEALRRVRADVPNVRVHLVGHSFGCRVVTAAASGDTPQPADFIQSMSLMQGAFSHYGFSANYDGRNRPGLFRNVVAERRVSGPLIITHTRADKAVGVAYAVASRIARQIAAAIGDKNDPYGGLGSNGARKTDEAVDGTLPRAGAQFDRPLTPGAMVNLLGDGLISSHGDVRNPHVAYAVLSAARAGSP